MLADFGCNEGYRESLRYQINTLKILPKFTGYDIHVIAVQTQPQVAASLSKSGGDIVKLADHIMSRQEQQFRERQLLPSRVDFSLLRKWRSLCGSVHGDLCQNPLWLKTEELASL